MYKSNKKWLMKLTERTTTDMMNMMRAVQFKPFNGLKGYDNMISNTEMSTPKHRVITDDRAAMLNQKLSELHKGDTVVITYFTQQGYINRICCIKEIDPMNRVIRTGRGTIPFQDLWNIESGF